GVRGAAAPKSADRMLEVACRSKQLVEVRHLAVVVAPGGADRAVAGGQEGRAHGDVPVTAELASDPEALNGVGVPVGHEREVQVEGLCPGDVRPGRVA